MHNVTKNKYERSVLVGVITPEQNESKTQEYIDELSFLTKTSGSEVVKVFIQKVNFIKQKTFIGSGKIAEIKEFIVENDVSTVIFDDELTPTQLRNIERFLECKVLDRTNLILDIFAQRATTSYACTQVELAQYQYLLPRLTRMWTHLERQKGGIGMRGPGETQIETDRRIIIQKISLLKEKLSAIDKQMATQRKNRGKLVRVALVGYTNVGKSTMMNTLAKTQVLAENKLFSTLDTTVRKIVVDNIPFLMTDTVGFIRKLPTQLVESFKSTLDEVREADLLIHIVDVSHPSFEDQIVSVNKILTEIGAQDKEQLLVFNKIDKVLNLENKDDRDLELQANAGSIKDLREKYAPNRDQECIFISVRDKINIDSFKKKIYDRIKEIHVTRFPYNDFLYLNYDDQGNITE
ncbi:GTPase HflX [Ichthyobacterium seriolicida]|uniref:GTPase HflX n=1 Tax=Ichthyobacterium seriolicida TaxID=242600 RepID=A0A1J1E5D6_9FLAO|nr:GTPase HflX [Ichthyobacterium seriolicida]BAV94518.1 GTP-binding protein HflX [Ichthyobacterium seriolicida]